jgi:ketosteroid isomerase-like protein
VRITDEQIRETLQRGYDAFNRGDYDAVAELVHPDVLFIRPGAEPALKGSDAFRAWMEPDAFESQVSEPREVEIRGQRVLVHQHTTARGAGSGIEMGIDSWAVWTFDEEGRVTRIETYLDHEEAEARRAFEMRGCSERSEEQPD